MSSDRPARATLETVARELGLSTATVSNAYNRPDQLSAATRQRVLEAAARLGYPGPHPVAATLRRGRIGALAWVFEDPISYVLHDPAAVAFLRGLGEGCEEAGVALTLVPGAGPDADPLRTALADGFVWDSDLDGGARLEALAAGGRPLVIVDGPPRTGAGHVGIDDHEGARLAAGHLLGLGHRRIAVVALRAAPGVDGPLTGEPAYRTTRRRLDGYRAAGLDPGAEVWACAENTPEAGARAAGALLDRDDPALRPTAILAMSDQLALGVMAAAATRRIRVPAGLSVVGFDDIPEAAGAGLTTIHQPHQAKGATAARLLLDPAGVAGQAIQLPVQRVLRASTAPPPA